MLNTLNEIKSKAIEELNCLQTLNELEQWRVRYLGKKSALTQVLRGLGSLAPAERKAIGASANELKALLESYYKDKNEALKQKAYQELEGWLMAEKLDVTLPGRPIPLGRLHPITQMLRQICDIFVALGFQVVEGPEVEWDYYNFEALNIPPHHPAREMWATFWIDYQTESGERPMLLRTHTSPMQIRVCLLYTSPSPRD